MKTTQVCIIAVACVFLGNWLGDQATLRDCATHGKAKMLGKGTIECVIVKEVSK